jgi:uncharacterized protein YcgI (DUF1989 family)
VSGVASGPGPVATPVVVLLAAGEGCALRVPDGAALTIEQVAGGRAVSLVSLVADDPGERLSMFTTTTVNKAWRRQPGDVLMSADSRPLWGLEEDTLGDAYSGGGWCRSHDGGSCEDVLHEALAELGQPARSIGPDAAFNPFLPVAYGRDLSWVIGTPVARAGDRVVLRSRCDQLVAVAHCADGATPGEVRVRVHR